MRRLRVRTSAHALVALLLLAALGGCLTLPGSTPPTAPAPQAIPVATAPADTDGERRVARRAPAAPPSSVTPPPPRLVGLAAQALVDVLGSPTLKRRDPPAEVWQYAGRGCVLHLFLYAPPDGTALAVAHAEASDADGRPMTGLACAGRLAGEAPRTARQS